MHYKLFVCFISFLFLMFVVVLFLLLIYLNHVIMFRLVRQELCTTQETSIMLKANTLAEVLTKILVISQKKLGVLQRELWSSMSKQYFPLLLVSLWYNVVITFQNIGNVISGHLRIPQDVQENSIFSFSLAQIPLRHLRHRPMWIIRNGGPSLFAPAPLPYK